MKLTSDISANVVRCDVSSCPERFYSYSCHTVIRKQAREKGWKRASRGRVMRAFELGPDDLDGGKFVDVCSAHVPPSKTTSARRAA